MLDYVLQLHEPRKPVLMSRWLCRGHINRSGKEAACVKTATRTGHKVIISFASYEDRDPRLRLSLLHKCIVLQSQLIIQSAGHLLQAEQTFFCSCAIALCAPKSHHYCLQMVVLCSFALLGEKCAAPREVQVVDIGDDDYQLEFPSEHACEYYELSKPEH
jgi:hypothetical protein